MRSMRRIERLALILPPLLICVLGFLSAPPWPDDWDGFGFLESIHRFDMEHFSPHPPGYPVYVMLLRFAAIFLHDPMQAAIAVAVASGVVVFLSVQLASRDLGRVERTCVAFASVGNPLAWRTFTGVGSEAPALALAAIACAAIVVARKNDSKNAWPVLFAAGALGFALGVRLSWAPLLLAFLFLLPKAQRLRGVAITSLTTLLWLTPLLVYVGPSQVWTIYRAHFSGHASRWGGTAVTDSHLGQRVLLFLRDVWVDGIGLGGDILGLALGLSVVLLTMALISQRKTLGRRPILLGLVLLPYCVWVFFGQNLREQPRHVLPLVVALVVALATLAAIANRTRILLGFLFLMTTRTALDAYQRRTIPPTGEQLVLWMKNQPNAIVFGGASVRFFTTSSISSEARGAQSMGDVQVILAKMNRPPPLRFVTSEIEETSTLPLRKEFCRPQRLDRKPCLSLQELR